MNQQVQVISLPSESRESDTKWWIFRSVYVWDTVNPPKKKGGYNYTLWLFNIAIEAMAHL
jgi:hypothetical protein